MSAIIASRKGGVLIRVAETGVVHASGCESSVVANRRDGLNPLADGDASLHKHVWFDVIVGAGATAFARAAQHFFTAGAGVAVRLAQQEGAV